MSAAARRLGLVWALAAIGSGLTACSRDAPPAPPPPAQVAAPAPAVETTTVAMPEPDPPEEDARLDAAPETVTIKLVADQRRQAHVFWGRKDLGVAPLEVTRPRGSGPLDLLVVADGCLPLHTRAFTERNETLVLRLQTAAEAPGLPGYAQDPTTKNPTQNPTKNQGIKPTTGPRKPRP